MLENVIVAQIRFPINFQKKDEAFNKTKERLESILDGQKGCKNLSIINILFKDRKSVV